MQDIAEVHQGTWNIMCVMAGKSVHTLHFIIMIIIIDH